jgi:CheY-like chemotaxis protein
VIFLDIHMTPYDGFTVLKMLRSHERYRQAKIVAVTASVMNEEVELLKAAGFDGALAKPIDPEFCPEFIKRIISGERVWHVG